MKHRFLLLFLLWAPAAFAQQGLGSWNIINAKIGINERWSAFVEPQLRSLSFYNQFHYYEIKGGLTFSLNSKFSFTAGVGSYNTYSEGGNFMKPFQQKEVRTWLQLVMKQDLERLKFEHRYRAEQRFTTKGYRNRYRYRLNVLLPINKPKVEPNTFFVSVWNEIFFTDTEPYFERNRFFVGGGYEFTEAFALQIGYLHQFDYKINDETGRDFLQISCLFNFDLQSKTAGFKPGVSD
jgi:hypothetical protein